MCLLLKGHLTLRPVRAEILLSHFNCHQTVHPSNYLDAWPPRGHVGRYFQHPSYLDCKKSDIQRMRSTQALENICFKSWQSSFFILEHLRWEEASYLHPRNYLNHIFVQVIILVLQLLQREVIDTLTMVLTSLLEWTLFTSFYTNK